MTCLISSYEADFSSRTTRSTTDTSEVGTRKDMPVSLPLSEGMTLPTACGFSQHSPSEERSETNLGSTSRGRDDVGGSATASAPVLYEELVIEERSWAKGLTVGRAVDRLLRRSGSVNGRHETLDNGELG
jgi:hypothetical protein